MTAPELSPAEATIVARFDAAPVPPEVVVADEVHARLSGHLIGRHVTLYGGQSGLLDIATSTALASELAAAAIAAMPPSPAEEAVKRLIGDLERGRHPGAAADLVGFVVARLRGALASPAPAPHDTGTGMGEGVQ